MSGPSAEPLQRASQVLPDLQLKWPVMFARIRRAQLAPVQGQLADVVDMVHVGASLMFALLLFKSCALQTASGKGLLIDPAYDRRGPAEFAKPGASGVNLAHV